MGSLLQINKIMNFQLQLTLWNTQWLRSSLTMMKTIETIIKLYNLYLQQINHIKNIKN